MKNFHGHNFFIFAPGLKIFFPIDTCHRCPKTIKVHRSFESWTAFIGDIAGHPCQKCAAESYSFGPFQSLFEHLYFFLYL